MLKSYVRKTKYGYRGYISCINEDKIIWKENAGITRTCYEDAYQDAEFLKRDRQATWIDDSKDAIEPYQYASMKASSGII